MAILTPVQLEALRAIIRDASVALAISTTGYQIPDEQLQRLIDQGFVDPDQLRDVVGDAFEAGRVTAIDPAAREQALEDLRRRLGAHPIPRSDIEEHAAQVARDRAGQYCVGLGNRWSDELQRIVVDADAALAARMREMIQDATAGAVERRRSIMHLASDLRGMTEDWGRDWERIARTEAQSAHQEGYFEATIKRHGSEESYAKIPDPGACDHCRRIYLDDEGKPMVRPMSWWLEQGTNVGRKASDWQATIGPAHPHCLVPGSLIETARGRIPIDNVTVGNLVLTHRGRWRSVTALHRHFHCGVVADIDGMVITGNHPIASGHQWKRADQIGNGDALVKIAGDVGLPDLNPDDVPSARSQEPILASVLLLFSGSGVPMAAVDLDGNLARLVDKIDEKPADNDVVNDIDSEIPEPVGDAFLVVRERLPLIVGSQPEADFVIGCLSSTHRLMSRSGDILSFRLGHLLHADLHRFASTALASPGLLDCLDDAGSLYTELAGYRLYGQAVIEVHFDDGVDRQALPDGHIRSCRPAPPDPAKDRSSRHSKAARDIRRGFPVQVPSDDVINVNVDFSHAHFVTSACVSVKKKEWSGYVHNLSVDEDESYVAEGVLVHNCRCEGQRVPAGFRFMEDGSLELDDDAEKSLSKGGPYIGPRGGKWADAAHTIPWKEHGTPPGSGWEKIPDSSHGGYRRRTKERHDVHGKWEYWFPGGKQKQAGLFGDEHAPVHDGEGQHEPVKHGAPQMSLFKARKLHARREFRGLQISIENRKGSVRHWYDPHEKREGTTRMQWDYGYIEGTKGKRFDF